MTVKECAIDAGRSEQSIRSWINERGLKATKGFKEYSITPEDWETFCDEWNITLESDGIERKGVEGGR